MWRGKRFVLPGPQEFPLETLEAEEGGKHLTALWATVASALGQDVTDAQLADPTRAFTGRGKRRRHRRRISASHGRSRSPGTSARSG